MKHLKYVGFALLSSALTALPAQSQTVPISAVAVAQAAPSDPPSTTSPAGGGQPSTNSRTKDFLLDTFGPGAFIGAAFGAAVDQGRDRPSEWGQGAEGFGRRYANSLGRNAVQQTTTYGFDLALGLDSRYRKSTKSGFFPRFGDVVVQTFTARTKSGRRVPGFPLVAGAYAGGFIPVAAWYPDRHGPRDGARIGTLNLVGTLGSNFLREFVFRR